MNQKYFIKATLKGGVSSYDQNFVYREGENIHPAPDYDNKAICGEGIHLARTIENARSYVEEAREFYLATVKGKIIAGDRTKVRVDGCFLIRIPDKLIKAYDEACATAWKAYDEACATARKVYDEACATARKVYYEACATARNAYYEARATAWKAYDEACATAWKALIRRTLKKEGK